MKKHNIASGVKDKLGGHLSSRGAAAATTGSYKIPWKCLLEEA